MAAQIGYLSICRRRFAFRIVRIPKKDVEATKYRAIHQNLITLEEMRNATREGVMAVYGALESEDVRSRLDQDYLQGLLERTLELRRAFLPEDYARIYLRLKSLPKAASGFTSELNEGVRRLSGNFNKKQIAIILKAYSSLNSRSLGTIDELLRTFNRGIHEAEVWQLRDVASALATLRVPLKEHVETFYKSAVAQLPKHLKGITGDDIGVFLNAFSRQGVSHDEVLHFVDSHAQRLIKEASFRNVALIANTFAKAERHSRAVINAVAERLHVEVAKNIGTTSIEVISRMDANETNGSKGTTGVSRMLEVATVPQDEEKVPQNVLSRDHPLNVIDVAMIFNAFTKLEEHSLKLLNAYIPWLNHHINAETPTLSLVLLCHAYSRAGVNNRDLYMRMAQILLQRVNTLNCQQLGVVALSYAKAGQNIPLLFLRLADEVIYRGTVALKFKRYDFDFQSLEQLMQAFSRVGFRDHRVYHVLTTLLKRRLRTAGAEELNGDMIASILTSMAPHKVDAFVPFITDAIVRTREATAYSTSAICRLLIAFGKLKIAHGKITESMMKEVKDRVNEFQIPVLINALKALAKLNKYNLTLVKESLKRCSMHLVHLTTQDIANLLSALSDFGFRNVNFLEKLVMCIKHRMEDFNRHQLHIIFSRLSMLRTSDAEVYRQLLPRLMLHQHEFNELELADVSVGYIYVLVHFDYLQREMHLQRMAHSIAEARKQQQMMQDQAMAGYVNRGDDETCEHNMQHSDGSQRLELLPPNEETMAGGTHNRRMPDPATNLAGYGFKDSILDAMLSHLGTKLDVGTIFKVQTVHLYLKHIRPDIYSKLSVKAVEALQKCSSVKFALAEYMLTSSSAHREVSHFFNLIGVCHRNEVQFGPYLVDIVPETSSSRKVAIEYDGPTHFYSETTMRTAKSILKHEILESAGWHVIHIPHQEWAQLVSAKQKIIYLDLLRKQYQDRYASSTVPLQLSASTVQSRPFSSALIRKRRYLLKINEQVLKEHLELPEQSEIEGGCRRQTASETDKIADELCKMLMDGKSNIVDIDKGEPIPKEGSVPNCDQKRLDSSQYSHKKMGFEWSRRPYTAPFLRDLIYNPGHRMPGQDDNEEPHRGEPIGQYRFVKHVPFASKVSALPLSDSQSGHLGGTGGCSSTLSLHSLVPSTAFGNLCSTEIRGSDIFFLPKPSQLLCFAIPVFVLMPNLTVFARQWFFYAPK
ncbi:uncharacterized protein BXIN_0634 [Babesia sp. Xinjiang]|uniref:uncharacterized protein n=1 Tax=Babesia sp. Xinjiang TaxID=462227 RepID=UPI000A24E737|nr:uncharacterized protein BXIN_0634 [Babesia sp. Xinjiang]ORM41828.1 hypothetical protein BXIN_0634 [Babesia sp. Xinjiang]